MKYKIIEEPKKTGNAFEVSTRGSDGRVLKHTFDFNELELGESGMPKWLEYIDDLYVRKFSNDSRYDFTPLEQFKYVERDLLKNHFEKGGKEFLVNHEEVLGIVKRVQATPTKLDDVDLLEDLKWVGPEMARALIDRFKDLRGVLNASKQDLLTISGIGEGNVVKILEEINKLK